ncbi:hypothetical protein RIF29_35353 [Crotalaria pallida]|uniref:Uncharacterized protein n=1 Tax=Crotalaria pallida TaxID=3830 RepID=A0AAN9HRN5_CROPI
MVTSLSNGHSEKRCGKQLMVNGDCTFLVLPIHRRRKVSAIRDFPEGCGLSDSKIHPETRVQTIDCSLMKEDQVVSSHIYVPPSANDEPATVQWEGKEAAMEDRELSRTPEAVKCDSFRMSKSPSTAFAGGSKFLSSGGNLSGSGSCLEKAVTTRYFPQRKFSAVRDFPPLCGKDASHLRNDESPNGNSSLENTSIDLKKLAVDDKKLEKTTATDAMEVEKNVQDGCVYSERPAGIVQPDSRGDDDAKKIKTHDVFEPSTTQLPPENVRERRTTICEGSSHHQVEITKAVDIEGNGDAVQFEGTSWQKIIVHPEFRSLETKPSEMSNFQHEPEGGFDGLQVESDRAVVLGLMAESECPWRHGRGSSKFDLIDGTNHSKGKKVDLFAQSDKSKADKKREETPNHTAGKKPSQKKKRNAAAYEGSDQLVIWEKKDSQCCNEDTGEFWVDKKSRGSSVVTPPINHDSNDSIVIRNKVREALHLFHSHYKRLLQEDKSKIKEQTDGPRVFHLQAAKILKDEGKYVNTGKQILGSVPGVEVGDEFQFRVELMIVGLHRPIMGGIDYVEHKGKILATSVVSSEGCADELDDLGVLTYTGQGGNLTNTDKEPEDQKLKRGNLALKNSSEEKNPVRVIRGSESTDGKLRKYVYDGQYVVEKYWQDMGPRGKLVFRFQLRRIPGQPKIAWKEVKKSKKLKIGEGLCVIDISHGKERVPIRAMNTIDDEIPPSFTYVTSMIYPDWCNPIPPEGCDCIDGCADSEKCLCAVRNGGEIPFNHSGAILEAKPLIYECGPSCKCTKCYNRVSQHGIKLQLEIFKTEKRGWGVRSLSSISSGTFICEYTGELLEDKDAEQRTDTDEYLFDLGNNYSNHTFSDGVSTVVSDMEGSSFTIDAAKYGNVGRFINHSCSPNLVAQNILYDHDDDRIPHVMLFAGDNIPPLQELTYDYNYKIDQVFDSDGNIKRKDCYCGSVECTGRLY